jgi:predicted ATPase/transcriptional regulator with XRE-family HTH domain
MIGNRHSLFEGLLDRMGPVQDMPFGARLRTLRDAAGVSQEELAERAGLTANAIGALERGERRRPYPHTLRALADALNLADADREPFFAAAGRPTCQSVPAPAPAPARAEIQLPAPVTQLIGRDDDVAAVQARLTSESARVVTLSGPGGVGKTRLAIEVALACGNHFADGVVFVPLAPVTDPALLIPTLAHALGLLVANEQGIDERVHAYLRDRRMLIVLDNMEHLLAGSADLAALIEGCPLIRVLVTSRSLLRVRGENVYPVDPLKPPDPRGAADAAHVLSSPAVELFAARAREANPAFTVGEHNAASVAAICWRLGGLPLALELAAARMRSLGATELLSRLDQALQSDGMRDLPKRQRSLWATLDWSYGLLAPAERDLFQRLSVFSGGFSLDAVEAVGSGEAVFLLDSLVEQSLVTMTFDGDETRYDLLEPIRQYAMALLERSGNRTTARNQHAAHYAAFAREAQWELVGSNQGRWLDRLERDHPNIGTALDWLIEQGDVDQVAVVGWAIWLAWARRGYVGEGLGWMRRAMASSQLSGTCRARALLVTAMLGIARGDASRVPELTAESARLARADHDQEILAHAITIGALASLHDSGDRSGADGVTDLLTEALAISRRIGDAFAEAHTLIAFSQHAMLLGDSRSADAFLADAERVARAEGNWFTLTDVLITRARVDLQSGGTELAGPALREGLRLCGETRDIWTSVLILAGLAIVATRTDNYERAVRLFGAADALRVQTGVGVSWSAWRDLSDTHLAIARSEVAEPIFATLWSEGRALGLHGSMELALDECLPSR